MINLDVLMLPVLSFSSPKSERRHAMEYNTDFNEVPHHCITVLGTKAGNPHASRFDHIFVSVSS